MNLSALPKKILKFIADFGYWAGRKADKLRAENIWQINYIGYK